MSGPMHDRGGYEDRETLRAQINALTDELDRLRERVSSHPHDIAMLERRWPTHARTPGRPRPTTNGSRRRCARLATRSSR
jgi:proteasome-associated ATPase